MTAVILCGGEGVRFKNEHLAVSKIMVEIQGKPLLWHIMRHYSQFGVIHFILCVKEDDEEIGSYFKQIKEWDILILKTGQDTPTGGRLKLAEPFVRSNPFFVTYGDGISNVDIHALLQLHHSKHTIATVTGVKARSQYGVLETSPQGIVTSFEEKPMLKDWINGGYFVFSKDIFQYITPDDSLEKCLLEVLVPKRELAAYYHYGFWKSIDTYKDYLEVSNVYPF